MCEHCLEKIDAEKDRLLVFKEGRIVGRELRGHQGDHVACEAVHLSARCGGVRKSISLILTTSS